MHLSVSFATHTHLCNKISPISLLTVTQFNPYKVEWDAGWRENSYFSRDVKASYY